MSGKYIRVEYEIPPLRAMYEHWFFDDGQSDEDISVSFSETHPLARLRKVERCIERECFTHDRKWIPDTSRHESADPLEGL